jgi:hypothetical protein
VAITLVQAARCFAAALLSLYERLAGTVSDIVRSRVGHHENNRRQFNHRMSRPELAHGFADPQSSRR